MNKLLQHMMDLGDVDHKFLPLLQKMQPGGSPVKVRDASGRIQQYNTASPEYKRLYNQGIGSWQSFDEGSGKWVSSNASNPNAEFVSSTKTLPEVVVTSKLKPNTLGSYSSAFYKQNPYENFYRTRYQEEKNRFESSPNWAQQSVGGWDRESRQQNVRDQINQEYQQKYVDYVSQMLQKRTPQGNRRRDEWLSANNFTDKELGFLTGSTNLPQPNLWAQGLQGAYNVADMVSFGQLPEINMPGIAKSEVSQYNNPLLALAPLSVPAKIVQSTYKDNYSVGDALAGRPNDASITEDIITDPLTWATFGAKGALTAAPRFGNMISNLNRVGRVVPRLSGAADDVSKTVGSFQKFKDGLRQLRENYVDFSGQIEGTFTKGRQAAIDEGNQWFAKWANDPATQAKINESLNDMRSTYQRYVDQTPEYKKDIIKGLEDNRARLENNFQHTLNYVPDSKEYPLWKQLVDFLGDQESVHRGNWGVSYGHGFEPWQLSQQGYTPKQIRAFQSANPREGGAWISRNRNLSNPGRTSTTVHENTHQWVKDHLLKTSGQSKEALAALTPEKRQLFEQWEALRNEGKTTKEIEEIMGKENADFGYLSDPTEVHARIMELRKHFGLKPGEMVTPEKANQMMGSVFYGDTPVSKKFGEIFQDEGSFANMFNKLWGVAPVAVGAGTLMNQKKQGGPIVDPRGQWAYPGQDTIVPTPTGQITMQGVSYPVYGQDETGYSQMMYPGGEYTFPGQMVYEKPIMQKGGMLPQYQMRGQVMSTADSVRHQANKILQYEQLRGGPGGAPLPGYSDPKYMSMLMNNIYPEVKRILPNASAMESAEAMDFIFNAGWDQATNKVVKDPRAYALQEYYRQYDPSKLDAQGNWSGRKNPAYSFDQEYNSTIGKLSENQRRVLMNKGRDWYYRNINNPAPGVPNSNYYDTWYGRIWNTNDFQPFNPNNPNFKPKKK